MPRSRKRLRNHAASGDNVGGVQAIYARQGPDRDDGSGPRSVEHGSWGRPPPVEIAKAIDDLGEAGLLERDG